MNACDEYAWPELPELPDLHTLNKMTKEMLDRLEEERDADAPEKQM